MSVKNLLSRTLAAAGFLLCVAAAAEAATPTNLQARFSKGQVFLTYTEVPGAGLTYKVFRSTSAITSVNGLTPIATLPQDSGLNRYTSQRFIVTDLGSPLAAGVGLLVYTTHENGTYFYAVTTSQDSNVVAGTNATTIGLDENVWEVPGAVQIGPAYQAGAFQARPYFAWEDYANWEPSWGYYGHRFNVVVAATLQQGTTYPLVLDLHGAGATNYMEPPAWVDIGLSGIFVFPVDNAFAYGNVDPYSGTGMVPTGWFGYVKGSGASQLAISATERRVTRYARYIASDAQYQVDPTRLYVKGASMGGGGAMHVAMHNPTVFAAGAASIAWVGPGSWGNWSDFAGNPPVNSPSGPHWGDWQDGTWMVEHATDPIPPIVHTFRKDDNIIPQGAYPPHLTKSEEFKRGYIARWQNGGHNVFWLNDHASFARFRLNEAYPAFGGASNSDPASDQEGQRNYNLDWSSSLHSLGGGTELVDTASAFAMSFKSLTTDATANVSLRNLQLFYLRPGDIVNWTNAAQAGGAQLQSGQAQADAQGVLTLTGLQIKAAGNRLSLTCQTCSGPPPPRPPRNVRITGTTAQ